MLTNIRYILLTALRDWLFVGLIFGIAVVVLIANAMGDMAMLEEQQLRVSYAAAASRLVLVVGVIVFVCFHVRNMFDTKEIDVFLSRPISRNNLVLSYWLGFSLAAFLLVIPTVLGVWLIKPLDLNGFSVWAATMVAEILLVVAVALFSSFTLRSGVASVMSSFGFYFLSRMMGFFIATSHSASLFRSHEMNEVSRMAMEYLAIIVPRLDFFAKTEWLVYGISADMTDLWRPLIQAAIFIPLLLFATMMDFRKKQF